MADEKTIYESAETLYKKAVSKMNDEELIVQYAYKIDNFNLAANMLEECGDYLDAPELAKICREKAAKAEAESKEHTYQRAKAELSKVDLPNEMWAKVRDAFKGLGDYKDAKKLMEQAQAKVNYFDRKFKRNRAIVLGVIAAIIIGAGAGVATGYFRYLEAYGFMKAGMYEQALENFERRSGQFNSDEYAAKCRELLLVNAKVGENVRYGSYEWKLIGKNGNVLTLIAAALKSDSPFYNVAFNEAEATENGSGETTWATSTLRAWLNGEIYENGFSDKEKEHMLLQTTPASKNLGTADTAYTEATEDYITLLTAEQADKYADMLKSLSLDYWLATPGSTMDRVTYVSGGRHMIMSDGYTADSNQLAVRPIIKVDCTGLGE